MKKGFTLIEVLVTTLIVGIIGLGSIFAIVNSQQIVNEYTKQAFVVSSVKTLMDRIANDIREGAELETDGSTLTIKYIDKPDVVWSFTDSKITRDDVAYEPPLAGTATFEGSFVTSISKYHSSDVQIDMTICDGVETIRKGMTNTFYCRIDSENLAVVP